MSRCFWSLINIIAIPVVLGVDQSNIVKFSISLIGFFVHFAFFVAARRGNRWILYWEERLSELEQLDQGWKDTAALRVRVFSHPDFLEQKGAGLTTRKILKPVAIIALIFWFDAIIYFCYSFVRVYF